MSHLEDLIAEYYDWRGYLVKRNQRVGRLSRGGWEMELDVVAYDPRRRHLLHLEPSLDADSWERREERFFKKFDAGKRYIFDEVFPWLDASTPIEQVAVLISHPKNRDQLAGAAIRSVDEVVSEIRREVAKCGLASCNAIPEQLPLLRTIQLTCNGYYRAI